MIKIRNIITEAVKRESHSLIKKEKAITLIALVITIVLNATRGHCV